MWEGTSKDTRKGRTTIEGNCWHVKERSSEGNGRRFVGMENKELDFVHLDAIQCWRWRIKIRSTQLTVLFLVPPLLKGEWLSPFTLQSDHSLLVLHYRLLHLLVFSFEEYKKGKGITSTLKVPFFSFFFNSFLPSYPFQFYPIPPSFHPFPLLLSLFICPSLFISSSSFFESRLRPLCDNANKRNGWQSSSECGVIKTDNGR